MSLRRRARTRLNTYYVPNGIADVDRFLKGLKEVAASLGETGGFIGDNLVTWGRSMSFALDANFMRAFYAATPDVIESAVIWRTHVLYGAARHGLRLDGDFVEAACYKGFNARVVADALGFAAVPKTYWLYDRFDIPDDAVVRLRGHDDSLFDRVRRRFADMPNVRIVKGAIPAAFADGMPERIGFLHIDMNNVEAEIAALDALWERMTPGAILILDDYGWNVYRAQKDAEDAWFAARGRMVIELPTGQGMVVK